MEVLDQPTPAEGQYNFDEKIKTILSNGYEFDLGKIISNGHKILMKDLGSYIGFLLVAGVITIVINFIPVIGFIGNFIIGYSLFMGFAIFARRIWLERPRQFSNFFDGFRLLGPLVLLKLLNTILYAIIIIPFVLITMGSAILGIIKEAVMGHTNEIDPSIFVNMIGKILLLVAVILILQALLSFATYIVTFGRKGAVDAMTLSFKIVGKRFISFILFYIVLLLINMGGAVCLLIGLLYTVPLTWCSVYAAYEMIVGTNPNDELLDR